MANFSARWGAYDSEGSINTFVYTHITANGLPAWMPSARVLYTLGTEGLVLSGYSGHAFTVSHLGSQIQQQFEGGAVDNGQGGYIRQGSVQIDCWASKTYAGEAFASRIRVMRDMVSQMIGSGTAVLILNAYASTATPPSVTAIVRIQPMVFDGVTVDRNPDFIRIRGVSPYTFTERNG